MPNPIDTSSASRVCALVEFRWGTSASARYAVYTDNVTAGGNLYSAKPAIEINYGTVGGGTKDEPYSIRVPADLLPVTNMRRKKWYPTVCRIYECDPSSPDATLVLRRKSDVSRATENPAGRTDLVELELRSLKSRLDVKLSLMADVTCNWTLGDSHCRKPLGPLQESGTLSAISDRLVTITGLPAKSAGYWELGTIKRLGYEISIRRWETGDVFELFNAPPDEWLNQTVTLLPGCPGTLEVCRSRFDNERRFSGFGLAMPDYNPQFEIGDAG